MSTSELGKVLAGLANNQSTLAQNISPDVSDPLFSLYNQEGIIISGVLTVTNKLYATNSFIIDHPVYGEIDSAILLIDGGYASSALQDTYII